MLPVFVCPGCRRWLQLPYRSFVSSSAIEPYWPSDSPSFAWVCDHCGRFSVATVLDLHWVAAEHLAPLAPARAFWRVEVPCVQPGCEWGAIAHFQTFGITSRKNLGLMLATAVPTPACALGHPAASGTSAYPRRIDFIEWNGPDEYVV